MVEAQAQETVARVGVERSNAKSYRAPTFHIPGRRSLAPDLNRITDDIGVIFAEPFVDYATDHCADKGRDPEHP